VPRPKSVETAWAAIPSVQAAVDLLGLATELTAGGVTSGVCTAPVPSLISSASRAAAELRRSLGREKAR